jgi:dynein heavy chain
LYHVAVPRSLSQCVVDAPKSAHLPTRLSSVVDHLTRVVYTNVCYGLFQAHKLMFALLLCVLMLRRRGELNSREWLLLLRGAISASSGAAAGERNPAPSRMDASAWATLLELDACSMGGLARSVSHEWAAWAAWASAAAPESAPLPEPWQRTATAMQRLVLIRVLRPEAIISAAAAFVTAQLGARVTAAAESGGLEGVLSGVDCKTPVVFVLTQVCGGTAAAAGVRRRARGV